MASNSSKAGLEGDQNPWAPTIPDLLTDEPSPPSSPEEPSEQPPQYSDARHTTAPASPSSSTSRAPLPPLVLPLHKYIIPISTTSPDQITTTSKHASFYGSHDTLLPFLKDQVLLPPKPIIQITGKHTEWNSTVTIDFDLRLNLTPLLMRPSPQSWSYLKFPTPSSASSASTSRTSEIPSRAHTPPQSLESLSHAFTTDPSPSKSLTLTRTPTHLDTSYLHGQILALLSTLEYSGSVTITFPAPYSILVIQKGTALGQTWRSVLNTAASWMMMGKAPAKPTSYSVEVVWPFATAAAGTSDERRFAAGQSEVEWWAVWGGAVRNAVLSGRRGWVGVEDWMEAGMGWREEAKVAEWGIREAR